MGGSNEMNREIGEKERGRGVLLEWRLAASSVAGGDGAMEGGASGRSQIGRAHV